MKLVSLENLSKYNELLNQKTVKSVNSVKPDSTGNVTLGTEKSTFNKVEFDTGYFSITSSKTYSFDLTGTDLENVSKDNVNIRLVAKVTTAHKGFQVGDIAQISTAFDVIDKISSVDVCAFISGNTLQIRSGGDSRLSIHNGTEYGWLAKANVQIKAVLTAFVPDDGSILLIAEDQTNTSKLIGLPDGTLTWKDKNLVRSVNGVNADENGNVEITTSGVDLSGVVKSVNNIQPDENGSLTLEIPSTDGMVKSVNSVKPDENGNVQLGTEKSTFNKVVYDTGYFSIGTDKTYSFDLTGSDLENVSKENVNIKLVAKVTTAHNGFEVGDIAQLSPGIDYDGSGDLDVCSLIRGNTLYVYSGTNKYLSIRTGSGRLLKANVQIKAVLTAFVPSDGSILLTAEDQTNTSKLIGLPDGTLTWGDKNIVRSVNGVNADESGNIVLSSESSESSESHQSTDSINEISLDTYQKYHEITLNTSETTLKFIENQNSENNSTVLKLELFIKQGTGTNTVIWPENIKWENGTKPVLSLEKDNVDLISLVSLDNGQNFYGFSKAVWLS